MTSPSPFAAGLLDPADPDWLRRHGATYEWTPADAKRFERDYRSIVETRKKPRRGSARSIERSVGLTVVVYCVFGIVASIGLLNGQFEEPWAYLAAGSFIGAVAMLVTLIAAASAPRLRRGVIDDPDWFFTTMSVGVDRGALWLFRHQTLTLFTTGSFTVVEWTDDLILAFINKTGAHAFPRDKLVTTDAGRTVLEWFQLNWPEFAQDEGADAKPSVGGRIWRSLVALVVALIWTVVLTVLILGGVAFWRAGSVFHWRPPQDAHRPAAVLMPPAPIDDPPPSIILSGPRASEYLGRLAHPAPR